MNASLSTYAARLVAGTATGFALVLGSFTVASADTGTVAPATTSGTYSATSSGTVTIAKPVDQATPKLQQSCSTSSSSRPVSR